MDLIWIVLCILALWYLCLYVIATRSLRGVDQRPGQPEDPEGLPRHLDDLGGRTGGPEDPGRLQRPIRFTPIYDLNTN